MSTCNKYWIITIAAAAALSGNAAVAADSNQLMASEVSTLSQWYGRAGGPVGAERIAGLKQGNQQVTVTYDAAIAARTNMSLERSPADGVAITYDREVAARTNMPREQQPDQVRAAGVPGGKTN